MGFRSDIFRTRSSRDICIGEPSSSHMYRRDKLDVSALRNVFPFTRFRSSFPSLRRREDGTGSLEGEERERGISRVDSKSSETTPRELCRQCCWLSVHYDVIESSWYGMYLLLTYRCRSRIIALKARTVLFKAREYERNVRTPFARIRDARQTLATTILSK